MVFDILPLLSLIQESNKILTCIHLVFVWKSSFYPLKNYLLTQVSAVLVWSHWFFKWLSSWPLCFFFIATLLSCGRRWVVSNSNPYRWTLAVASPSQTSDRKAKEQGLATWGPTLRSDTLRKKTISATKSEALHKNSVFLIFTPSPYFRKLLHVGNGVGWIIKIISELQCPISLMIVTDTNFSQR